MRSLVAVLGALALASGCSKTRPPSVRPGAETRPGAAGTSPAPRELVNSIGMKFVLIPPGEFAMGSPETEGRRNFDEGPGHRVRISKAFYVGVTEVTQREWKAVMGENPSEFKGDELPVEHVSWKDAQEFVKKLSEKERRAYRLPTEAEWEYACRAGTTTPFYAGETISVEQANYDGTYAYGSGAVGTTTLSACLAGRQARPGEKGVFREKTTPAGSFEPNPWGLHDMCGNIHEWCADWYDAWYYEKSPSDDPPGGKQTSSVTPKILRGGAWDSAPWVCRSASRHRDYPGYGDDFYGLRLVLEP